MSKPNVLTFNTPFAKTDIPTGVKSGDVKADVQNVDVGAMGDR